MGRGLGGSKSYGKRTPGGIKTSSKMSKVGEIEAKHGVLGDDSAGLGNLKRDELRISLPGRYGDRDIPVYKNPTSEDITELNKRFRSEFPDAPRGEPKIRTTFDMDGNEYAWMSGDAMHYSMEDALYRQQGVETHQHKGWMPDGKFDYLKSESDSSAMLSAEPSSEEDEGVDTTTIKSVTRGIGGSSRMSAGSQSSVASPKIVDKTIKPPSSVDLTVSSTVLPKKLGLVMGQLFQKSAHLLPRAIEAFKKQSSEKVQAEIDSGELTSGTVLGIIKSFYNVAGFAERDYNRDIIEKRQATQIRDYVNSLILDDTNDKNKFYSVQEFLDEYDKVLKQIPGAQQYVDNNAKLDNVPLFPVALEKDIIDKLYFAKTGKNRAKIDTKRLAKASSQARLNAAMPGIKRDLAARQARVKQHDQAYAGVDDSAEARTRGSDKINQYGKKVDPDGVFYEDPASYQQWLDAEASRKVGNQILLDDYELAVGIGKMMNLKKGEKREIAAMPGWSVKNNDGVMEVYANMSFRIDYEKAPPLSFIPGTHTPEPNQPSRFLAQHLIDATTGEYLKDHAYVELTDDLKKEAEAALQRQSQDDGDFKSLVVCKGRRPTTTGQPSASDWRRMYEATVECRVYTYANRAKVGLRPSGVPLPMGLKIGDGKEKIITTISEDGTQTKELNPDFKWQDGSGNEEYANYPGKTRPGELEDPATFV